MNQILEKFISTSKSNEWEPTLPLPEDIWDSDFPSSIDFKDNFAEMYEYVQNDDMFVDIGKKTNTSVILMRDGS